MKCRATFLYEQMWRRLKVKCSVVSLFIENSNPVSNNCISENNFATNTNIKFTKIRVKIIMANIV